jgi:hypothetical protein
MKMRSQLAFNRQDRQAFELYETVLGGKIAVMNTFGGSDVKPPQPPWHQHRIRSGRSSTWSRQSHLTQTCPGGCLSSATGNPRVVALGVSAYVMTLYAPCTASTLQMKIRRANSWSPGPQKDGQGESICPLAHRP